MEILKTITEKWQMWTGDLDVPDPIPDFEKTQILEMERAARELLKQQQSIVELLQTQGWKLLEEYRSARIEVLRSQLERLNVEDEAAKDLRAELRILRGYENFLVSKLDFQMPN